MLELKNISYFYKSQKDKMVLDQISYQFEKGKMYAILGASGSGKTTLLSLLAGLDSPISGEIDMCSNSFGSRSARITFCEKRNLRCTLCETTMSGFMCAAPTAIRALPLTGCMTLSTRQPDTVFSCAARLLTIAVETP